MFATAFQANAFQNNAFQIAGLPPTPTQRGGDDGYITKEELRRIQRLQQKIAARQRKLEQSAKDANAFRKDAIRNLVDPKPVAKVKQSKVQFKQEVEADIPLAETEELQRSIAYLERQLDNLQQAVAQRQEFARLQAHLRILEAKRLEELDDEEAILFLM